MWTSSRVVPRVTSLSLRVMGDGRGEVHPLHRRCWRTDGPRRGLFGREGSASIRSFELALSTAGPPDTIRPDDPAPMRGRVDPSPKLHLPNLAGSDRLEGSGRPSPGARQMPTRQWGSRGCPA